MDDYKTPEIPDYKRGFDGLVQCIGEFTDLNFPELDFEQYKTKKGSIGYVAQYRDGSNVSIFAYRDYDSMPMMELYWEEAKPSKRMVSIKMPIDNQDRYENSMALISGALPIFLDPDIEHAQMSNEELEDTLAEIISQADLHGALLSVDGDRGIEDDQAEEGDIELHEKPMENDEILELIDKALDDRNFIEAARLRGLLKESSSLKHLKDFKNFRF